MHPDQADWTPWKLCSSWTIHWPSSHSIKRTPIYLYPTHYIIILICTSVSNKRLFFDNQCQFYSHGLSKRLECEGWNLVFGPSHPQGSSEPPCRKQWLRRKPCALPLPCSIWNTVRHQAETESVVNFNHNTLCISICGARPGSVTPASRLQIVQRSGAHEEHNPEISFFCPPSC